MTKRELINKIFNTFVLFMVLLILNICIDKNIIDMIFNNLTGIFNIFAVYIIFLIPALCIGLFLQLLSLIIELFLWTE